MDGIILSEREEKRRKKRKREEKKGLLNVQRLGFDIYVEGDLRRM